jgi:predicted aconitase
MLKLTSADKQMLDGGRGAAAQMAMSIVVQMAKVYGAEALMDITAAHIDSTIYVGEAGLEFAERLVELGARMAVPATLNVSGVDERHWQDWPVPSDWAHNAQRQMAAYRAMGGKPTWTCAPYQLRPRPRLGQQIVWGESNAIAFANSVLGARTERYPDLLDICCAITGRVPAVGLHLTENRAGQVLVELVDVPADVQSSELFYPVFGYLLGKIARDRVPAVTSLEVLPAENQLKALCAAAASSGSVSLFHLVGFTPEAPTVEAAFQGGQPERTVSVTLEDLRAGGRELHTAAGVDLDMVVVGCPHFCLREFAALAQLVNGNRLHPNVRFNITSNRAMVQRARDAGHLDAIEAFGATITVDTCPLATPMLPPEVRTVMTNSGKHAYYAPGLLRTKIAFGSLAECVASAIEGKIVRERNHWWS